MRLLVLGMRLMVLGMRLLVLGMRLLVLGMRLLVLGLRLLVVGMRLLVLTAGASVLSQTKASMTTTLLASPHSASHPALFSSLGVPSTAKEEAFPSSSLPSPVPQRSHPLGDSWQHFPC
jgi:hypothetical protein